MFNSSCCHYMCLSSLLSYISCAQQSAPLIVSLSLQLPPAFHTHQGFLQGKHRRLHARCQARRGVPRARQERTSANRPTPHRVGVGDGDGGGGDGCGDGEARGCTRTKVNSRLVVVVVVVVVVVLWERLGRTGICLAVGGGAAAATGAASGRQLWRQWRRWWRW